MTRSQLLKVFRWPSARPAAHDRKGRRAKALTLFLLLASGLLLAYLFLSPRFYIFEIAVQGNEALAAEAILKASGAEGYSIFFLDPRQVVEAVESLPDVAQARVRYRLPNHLIIEIMERQPYLRWQTNEGIYLVDSEGIVLSGSESDLSLTLKDLGGGSLRAGDRINPQILEAAQIYSSLMPEVEEFLYLEGYGLGFIRDGVQIWLGMAQDAPAKMALLEALWGDLQGKEAKVIDLRFSEPYFRTSQE